jgi:hypothetical protein
MGTPYASDGGQLIGRYPRQVSIADLRALGGPISAGGNPGEVYRLQRRAESEVCKCVAIRCALWPFWAEVRSTGTQRTRTLPLQGLTVQLIGVHWPGSAGYTPFTSLPENRWL